MREYEFSITKPEWIRRAGFENAPEELADKRVESIRVIDGKAWFGVFDYGVASYGLESGEWRFFPMDTDEQIRVWGMARAGGKFFAGLSGLGLMALDEASGRWRRIPYPMTARSYQVTGLAADGDTLFMSTMEGLYRVDARSEELERISGDAHYSLLIDGDSLWTVRWLYPTTNRYLRKIDTETLEIQEEYEVPKQYSTSYEVASRGESMVFPTQHGYTVFSRENKTFEEAKPGDNTGLASLLWGSVVGEDVVITNELGLLYHDVSEDRWTWICADDGLPESSPISVAIAGGKMFLGLRKGVFIVDADMLDKMLAIAGGNEGRGRKKQASSISRNVRALDRWVHLTGMNGLAGNMVFDIAPDLYIDRIWVATEIMGLTRVSTSDFRTSAFIHESIQPEHLHFPVLSLFQRNRNLFHAGYSFYGSFDTENNKWTDFQQLDVSHHLNNMEAVWAGRDELWLAVRKEGLRVQDMNTGKWRRYKGDLVGLSRFVSDFEQVDDTLWISMDTGLMRYDRKDDEFHSAGLMVRDIQDMEADGAVLWLGARERSIKACRWNTGFFSYNTMTGRLVSFGRIPGIETTHINDIFVDGPHIWIASPQGLGRFDRLYYTWRLFSSGSKLEKHEIKAVAVSGAALAAGTEKGLFITGVIDIDDPDVLNVYITGWRHELRGEFTHAAELYESILDDVPAQMKDSLNYRIARCLQYSGYPELALLKFDDMLGRHPMLLLDLEDIFTMRYGFGAYIRKVIELSDSLPEDSVKRQFCDAAVEHIDEPLESMAARYERLKRYNRARDCWELLLIYSDDARLHATAREKLRDLRSSDR